MPHKKTNKHLIKNQLVVKLILINLRHHILALSGSSVIYSSLLYEQFLVLGELNVEVENKDIGSFSKNVT